MTIRLSWAVAIGVCACGGRGGGSTEQARDVSGNYALTYDEKLLIKLNVGGAIREVTQSGYGNVVDFGVINGQPTTLDLATFCAKPEVLCPSEAFWGKVAVTQPNLSTSGLDLQALTVVNDTVHVLDAGVRAQSVSGLVNHVEADQYLIGLGAGAGVSGGCGALGISLSGGRFSRVGEHLEMFTEYRAASGKACSLDAGVAAGFAGDAGRLPDAGVDCTPVTVSRIVAPEGAKVSGVADGKIFMGWAGGCAFGPVLVGATLTIETGYVGKRTGDYDPPPFTPSPVVLPDDGGVVTAEPLDAGRADAGTSDGGR